MSDDEHDEYAVSAERAAALGFRPQREILVNRLLPYGAHLDHESGRLLAEIRSNLARAVMLREMKPACGVWSSRLLKYLRIYGLKFSKEDHIALVRLVYELVLIPDLEPSKLHKFATLFIMLTKKRYLLSPAELTLSWRPLYEMGKKVFDKSRTHIGMYHYLPHREPARGGSALDMVRRFLSGSALDDALHTVGLSTEDDAPKSLESSYVSMVKCAKPYFEVSATAEILAELLPQISPWSSDTHTMGELVLFLPVALPPQHAARGHELWFDELMQLWDTCRNTQCGVSDLMMVFAGLAQRSPGAVDWAPHVPGMFVRFLHALRLPVSYKDMQYTRNHSLDIKQIACWIVWAWRPGGAVLRHLRVLLSGVESYLNSANSGRWSYKLRDLLRKLSKELVNRVRREREKKYQKSWENQMPEEYKLRDEDITEFVQIVLQPTLLAVHCRSGSADVSLTLRNLAILRPALVVPPLLDKLRTSLESLTEPHRVTAAMGAVAAVARAILRGPANGYPEGPTHVVPLLMASLPGLDPNDIKKTLITLHLIMIFSWMIPYIDCSNASEYWSDLTEEELLTCESTAHFEDFVLLFLDRLFSIVESSILENVRLETKESDGLKSKTETVIETALSSAATSVLMQCSPKIFTEALRKFKGFATNSTFETNVSGSMVGMLLRVFARVDSARTAAAFVPQLCAELADLLASDEALHDENPPRDLLYRLLLLSHAVEGDGNNLLKYVPQLTTVLDRALKLHAKEGISRATDILARMMQSLSVVELREFRSCSKDYSMAPQEWLPVREWGKGCEIKDAKFTWHTPSEEEVECAQALFDRFALPEAARLRRWLAGERDMCRRRRLRAFYILHAALCGTALLPAPDEPPVQLVESLVPATPFTLASGAPRPLTLAGANVRAELAQLLHRVQARLVDDKSDDTRGLEMLLQLWERVSGVRPTRTGPSLEGRMRSHAALKRAMDGKGGAGGGGGRVRTLVSEALRLQDEQRADLQADAGLGRTGLLVMDALYQLAVHTYTSVRILSQVRLYWLVSHYAYSYRALIPKIAELLKQGGEGDEWHARHKGALYIMLGPRTGPLIAKQDWETVKMLWPAVLQAPLSEKPSILRLEQAFSETLHRQFSAVNTRLTMTPSSVEAARCFLTTAELEDPSFVDLMSKSEQNEIDVSNKNEKMYCELLEELVRIAEEPNIQWRRLELILQMLTYCPSLQTPYPASAVRLVVSCLVHDDIAVRRTALRLTHFALKQRKHKVRKMLVDPYEVAGVPRPEKRVPGYRKDNEWAMWSESNSPLTDEDWDKPWLRNDDYGFYSWPDKLEVAAPAREQVSPERPPADMEAGERHLFNFFSDEEKVDRLVSFLTLEEKKGKDKFNAIRFAMFRVLFRSFGLRVAELFLSRALPHAAGPHEAPQRFAAEVAAAAVRAPRYWPRKEATAMYEKAAAVLTAGLTAVTPETSEDWGTCVASAVERLDPRRGRAVLDALVALCVPAPSAGDDADADHDASFGVCARLYALQGALGSLGWRTAPLAAQLLRRLEAARFLHHPYQNVRESVGSILMTIFDTELVFPGGSRGAAPCIGDFIDSIKPKLAALYDEHGEIVIKSACSMSGGACVSRDVCARAPASPEPERSGGDPLLCVSAERARLPTPPTPHTPPPTGSTQGDTEPEGSLAGGGGGGGAARAEKRLAHRLDAALTLDGDSAAPGPREHARAINLITTVLRGAMGVVVRGARGCTRAQTGLVRAACALAARGAPQPHDELGRAADGFLASLAMAHHDHEEFEAALTTLEDVASSRSWWARQAGVLLAQPLVFYALPLLSARPERARRAERLALRLMRDSRLEVRKAAAKLLTGLMHCRALPDEDSTLEALVRSCRSEQIVERHCGVLGLCAYIASRPYSLGAKIGLVLEELSRHISAPDPVPASIRAALADFRRTHQDDWAKHRDALTESELDLLADLTSPPSYCA